MNEQAANDERFRALVSATSDVVYRLSADWEVMYELDGRGFLKSSSQPIRGWRNINVYPLDMEMVNNAIYKAIASKSMFELEHRVVRADGSTGWTMSRAIPILGTDGEILEWFGAASDISLRKEAEERLQAAMNEEVRQKQVYETVTSNTPDLVYVFELDYTFSYVNKALLEMWGKSWEDAVGKGLLENGYEPWHAKMHEQEIDHIVATGERVRGEVAFPHAVLGKRIYDYILTPVFDSAGKVVAVSGVTRDVTERKLIELEKQQLSDDLATINEEMAATNEELLAGNEDLINARDMLGGALEKLSRSETKLRYLIANAPVAIALVQGRGMIIETANAKILEIWGKSDSVVGKPLVEAIPELIGQGFLELLDQVFTTGVAYIGKEEYAVLEGREWFLSFVYQPITGEDGIVDHILITATDVTELVQSRHKVEAAETAMRLAIEAANFGTWWIHSETREFVTSDRLKELFGFYPFDQVSIADAIGQITPEYQNYVSEKLEAAITVGGNYDVTYPVVGFHDGVLRWLRAVGNLKEDPSGGFSAFTGVVMEITESYLAVKNIERAEESLRLAIDAAELGSFQISVTDRTFIASPKFKEFFGYLPDDEVPYEVAIEQIHEDYREIIASKIEDSIVNGIRFDTEYPVVGFHDGKIRWVRAIGTVQHQNNGVDSYFTGVLHEITERKMDEMRKNDFIGMVSHELKTPLTSLNGYLQLMERNAKKVEDKFLMGTTGSALKQVKKMSGMINGFLNISRLESGKIVLEKSHFNLNELILETLEDTSQLESSANISFIPCEQLPVFADQDKISSVLSNFLSNAVKYSPSGSEVKVSCGIFGDMAQVTVSDQGQGLREKDLEKVFERFYRVEDNINISGFGIGLYLSAEIIHRHGGKIWVESEFGKGSTFYFNIPLVVSSAL
ncbi:PAS domain S-box protein [Pedobacter polaris]|uniref:histidine kinase n=1 Tax=Pedobacter polaris TaxID=2571273 RepID=A0A4U1CS82_9SPHI|nr:PAS domain S-box protein [Pedobacter polaris]TKC09880.1 PAS domain S-box protein [Pedobacter polaris]